MGYFISAFSFEAHKPQCLPRTHTDELNAAVGWKNVNRMINFCVFMGFSVFCRRQVFTCFVCVGPCGSVADLSFLFLSVCIRVGPWPIYLFFFVCVRPCASVANSLFFFCLCGSVWVRGELNNKSFYFSLWVGEINQQTNFVIGGFQVVQNLGFVDTGQSFYCFNLKDNFIFD